LLPAIKVENLSKQYQLGLTHAGSLRELVNGAVARLVGRAPQAKSKPGKVEQETIWALKDVNFEVMPGEAIGIIGRNGAGKSTLLKILSRITKPTDGRVELRGRVASLLEVGTGFHPELTGRENVLMNGAILGMTKKEIQQNFDSIVDFAGVEKFIDTPVKRYSSGMTVRLGFAVAAHMSPEILIVDEVLAVGDAEFQKRCMGKMDDVAKSGRTVLFVSHNMASIRQLTRKTLFVENGTIAFFGNTDEGVYRYLSKPASENLSSMDLTNYERAAWAGSGTVKFIRADFVNGDSAIESGTVELRIDVCASELSKGVWLGVTIFRNDGTPLASSFTEQIEKMAKGERTELLLAIKIPQLPSGQYWFRFGLLDRRNQILDVVDEVLRFDVDVNQHLPAGYSQWNSGWGHFSMPITQKINKLPIKYGHD